MCKKVFYFLACFSFSFVAYAQQNRPTDRPLCGSIITKEEYRKHAAFNQALNQAVKANPGIEADHIDHVYRIPVVFHILYDPADAIGSGTNYSVADIETYLRTVNEHLDQTKYPANQAGEFEPIVAGDTKIRLVLAKRDPLGLPTNGITRVPGPSITSGEFITYSSKILRPNWNQERYVNVWIVNNNLYTAAAGEAQVPADASALQGFGQSNRLFNTGVFGPNTSGTFIFGRGHIIIGAQEGNPNISYLDNVLPHELGHHLGLHHPFDGGSCHTDDFVADTPNMFWDRVNSPEGCDGPIMEINIMDYASSSEYYYTKGQAERMRRVLQYYPPKRKLWENNEALEPVPALVSNNGGFAKYGPSDENTPSIIPLYAGARIVENSSYTFPNIFLTNYGSNSIGSARVEIFVNGTSSGPSIYLPLASRLDPRGTTQLTLTNTQTLQPGINTIQVRLLKVNERNDRSSTYGVNVWEEKVLYRPSGDPMPASDFSPQSLLSEDGEVAWDVLSNLSNPVSVVERPSGEKLLRLNFKDSESIDYPDIRIASPPINVTLAPHQLLKLRLKYAYVLTEDGEADVLQIGYFIPSSTDNSMSLFRKGGANLATSRINTNEAIPPSSAFKELSFYFPLNNVGSFVINGENNRGNNLFIEYATIEVVDGNNEPQVDLEVSFLTHPYVCWGNGGIEPVHVSFVKAENLGIGRAAFNLNYENISTGEKRQLYTNANVSGINYNRPFYKLISFANSDDAFYRDENLALPLREGVNNIRISASTLGDVNLDNNEVLSSTYYTQKEPDPVLPSVEHFESSESKWTPLSLPNSGWNVRDGYATVALYNAQENEIGQAHQIISPRYSFQSTEPKLSFRLSYGMLAGNTTDTLRIYALSDCIGSLEEDAIIYKKGGEDLATAAAAAPWQPTQDGHWRSEEVDLRDLGGEDDIHFVIVATNGGGNNIYIDSLYVEDYNAGTQEYVLDSQFDIDQFVLNREKRLEGNVVIRDVNNNSDPITSLEGIQLQEINGNLTVSNLNLNTLSGLLNDLTTITGSLTIRSNNQLLLIEGFRSLQNIGSLSVVDNTNLNQCCTTLARLVAVTQGATTASDNGSSCENLTSCSLLLADQEAISLPAAASDLETSIYAKNVTWQVTEQFPTSVDWINSVTPNSGTRSNIITISANQNTGAQARTATLQLAGGGITRNITLTQAAAASQITITGVPDEPTPYTAGVTTIQIQSNVDWALVYDPDSPWLSASPISGSSGTTNVIVTRLVNPNAIVRTGQLLVRGGGIENTISLMQQPTPTITVTERGKPVSSSGGRVFLDIQSNVPWVIYDTQGYNPWLRLSTEEGGSNTLSTQTAMILVEPAPAHRSTILRIEGSNITREVEVNQHGLGISRGYGSSSSLPALSQAGGSLNPIRIGAAPLPWHIESTCCSDWVSFHPSSSTDNTDYPLEPTVIYKANPSVAPRRLTFTWVYGSGFRTDFSANQPGITGIDVIDPIMTFPFQAGTQTIRVAHNGGSSLQLRQVSGTWVQFPATIDRSGITPVEIRYEENTANTPRSATIELTSGATTQMLEVHQAANGASLTVVNLPAENLSPEAGSFAFQILSNVNWTIPQPSPSSGITITPTTGTASSSLTAIKVDYEENTDLSSREINISINGVGIEQDINLVQRAGFPEITINNAPSVLDHLGAGDQQFQFTVTSNAPWEISTPDSFEGSNGIIKNITPTSGSASLLPQTVTATYKGTIPGISSRKSKIEVYSASGSGIKKSIEVLSIRSSESITLQPSMLNVNNREGEGLFSTAVGITSPRGWAVSLSDVPDWVTIFPTRGGRFSNRLFVSVEENFAQRREARIPIVSGVLSDTLIVTQEQARTVILVEAAPVLSPSSGTLSLSVSANKPWVALADVTWINFPSGGNTGGGIGTLTFNYEQYTSSALPREGEITLTSTDGTTSTTVRITQEGPDLTIVTDNANLPSASHPAIATIAVESNTFWQATPSNPNNTSNPSEGLDWIFVTTREVGRGNSMISFNYFPNTTGANRRVTFSVVGIDADGNEIAGASQTLTFTQASIPDVATGDLAFDPSTSTTLPLLAGTGTVTITTDVDWKITTNQSWLSFDGPTTGNSTISPVTIPFSFSKNYGAARIVSLALEQTNAGDVVLGGNFSRITITQEDAPFIEFASSPLLEAGGSATPVTIGVTATGSWRAVIEPSEPSEPSEPWIRFTTSGDEGVGDGNIAFTYDPTSSERSANIIVNILDPDGNIITGRNSRASIRLIQAAPAGLQVPLSFFSSRLELSSIGSSAPYNIPVRGRNSSGSNVQWTASKSPNTDWLTIEPGGETGTNYENIPITYAENRTGNKRFAAITITDGTAFAVINLTQLPVVLKFSGSPIRSLDPLSGTGSLAVQANVRYNLSIVPFDASWVRLTSSSIRGSYFIHPVSELTTISYDQNNTGLEREVKVIVEEIDINNMLVGNITDIITFTQTPTLVGEPTLMVTADVLSPQGSDGEAVRIATVSSNTFWEASIVGDDPDWITLATGSSAGFKDGEIRVTYEPSYSNTPRALSISITARDRGGVDSDTEEINLEQQGIPAQITSIATLTLSPEASSLFVPSDVSVGGTRPWRASIEYTSTATDWFQFYSDRNVGVNNGEILYTHTANNTAADRTARIVIKEVSLDDDTFVTDGVSHTINITQQNPIMALRRFGGRLLAAASDPNSPGEVFVSSNITWEATVSYPSGTGNWINFAADSDNGRRDGSVLFNYLANNTTAERTATITVTQVNPPSITVPIVSPLSQTIQITQSKPLSRITLPSPPTLLSEGNTATPTTVAVVATVRWGSTIEYPAGAPKWITFTAGGDGSDGNGDVSFTYDANPTSQVRTATLIVRSLDDMGNVEALGVVNRMVLSQNSAASVLEFSNTAPVLTAAGSNTAVTVSIRSNVRWKAVVEPNTETWITFTGGSNLGSLDGNISFTYRPNNTSNARDVRIVVSEVNTLDENIVGGQSSELRLIQPSTVLNITLLGPFPDILPEGSGATPATMAVGTSVSWEAELVYGAGSTGWVQFTPGGNVGNASGNLSFTYDINNGDVPRVVEFVVTQAASDVVAGATPLSVRKSFTQLPFVPRIKLPTAVPVLVVNGSNTATDIAVTANFSWKARSDGSWITFTNDAGRGNGLASFTYEANRTGLLREAKFIVEQVDDTGTPVSGGLVKMLTLSQRSIEIALGDVNDLPAVATNTAIGITVTANISWKATVVPNTASWITFGTGGDSGNGNGVVSFTYTTNSTSAVRNAEILVQETDATGAIQTGGVSKTIDLRQLASSSIALGEVPSLVSTGNDMPINIAVTANVLWRAKVSSTVDWITFTRKLGNRDARISFTYEANTDSDDRTAVLTVEETNSSGAVVPGGAIATIELVQPGTPEPKPEVLTVIQLPSSDVQLSPNPVRRFLNIQGTGVLQVSIYTVSGNVLGSYGLLNSGKIDLESLDAGLYIVSVQSGNSNYTTRILKR